MTNNVCVISEDQPVLRFIPTEFVQSVYDSSCLFIRLFVSGLGVPSSVGRGMKGGLKGWELKDTRRMERNGNFWENIFYIVKLVPLLLKRCRPIFYGFLNRSNFIFPFFQIITWLTYCKFCNIWNSLLEIRMYSIFKDLSSLFFFFAFFDF